MIEMMGVRSECFDFFLRHLNGENIVSGFIQKND